MPGLQKQLLMALEDVGFKAAVVAVEHLAELEGEIERLLAEGVFDQQLYQTTLSWFRFNHENELPNAKSVVIVAMPEPITELRFNWQGEERLVVLPPVYCLPADAEVRSTLDQILNPEQHRFVRAGLPLKLLAVRSGLATYGRNNITYVNGFGSYHRLIAFITDMPCEHDSWREPERMPTCDSCGACVHACPTECIDAERNIIHAERCLTYHNESADPFPDWLDASWHNALMGCMHCQSVCPENQGQAKVVKMDDVFTEQEVELMLSGTEFSLLPQKTRDTLEALNQAQAYKDNMLSRNLAALLSR